MPYQTSFAVDIFGCDVEQADCVCILVPASVGLDFREVGLDSYAGLGGCDGGVDEEEAEAGSEDLDDFAGLVLEDCPVASVAVEADDGGSRFWEHRAGLLG